MVWQAINVLEAREMLLAFTVADFPNASKSQRTKIHREMHKEAYPQIHEKKEVSTEAFAKFLSGMKKDG